MNAYACVCVCVCVSLCVCACVCVCLFVCLFICLISIYVCMYVCIVYHTVRVYETCMPYYVWYVWCMAVMYPLRGPPIAEINPPRIEEIERIGMHAVVHMCACIHACIHSDV